MHKKNVCVFFLMDFCCCCWNKGNKKRICQLLVHFPFFCAINFIRRAYIRTEWSQWMLAPEIVSLNWRQIRFTQMWWQIVRWNVRSKWTNIIQIIPEWIPCDGRSWQRWTWIEQIVQTCVTWPASTINWQSWINLARRMKFHLIFSISKKSIMFKNSCLRVTTVGLVQCNGER